MSEPRTTERICPQCGLKTPESMCPQHGIPTLARVAGAIDTVQTGEIIGGRFRVDKLLGKGGFGGLGGPSIGNPGAAGQGGLSNAALEL